MDKLIRRALYRRWIRMMDRCYNKKHVHWMNYGGRGITVAKRWHDFEHFLTDMSPTFSPELLLDREKNNKGYSPSNCKWSTPTEQQRNTRRNLWLTYNGERKTMVEWSNETGINKQTLSERLRRGWSSRKALETPVAQQHWSAATRQKKETSCTFIG